MLWSQEPVRSQGAPSGIQRTGESTNVLLSLTTDAQATCRYGTIANTAYTSLPYVFSSSFTRFSETGGPWYHQKAIYNIHGGQSYQYYVRCCDSLSGDENANDYVISFSAITDTAPETYVSTVTIDSAVGIISDDSLLTISGNGFGSSGPSVMIFDDFEGGTPGSDIQSKARVGEWETCSSYSPTYSTTCLSGQYSMQISDPLLKQTQQFCKTFPSPVQEIFLSYWVRIPDNTLFPSATAYTTLSSVSCWKLVWIFNGPEGYASPNNDLCLPTWPGGSFSLGGNDSSLAYIGADWWTFDRFIRISVWLKANSADPLLPGQIWFSAFQDGVGFTRRVERSDIPLYDADNPTSADGDYYCTHAGAGTLWCQPVQPKQWDRMTVPGWLRQDVPTSPVYDDFYAATGNGAQARVEIGDAPQYWSCKKITLATVESWSDNLITARFRLGAINSGQAYLYVFDSQGRVNSQGYPVTVEGSRAETAHPAAPTGLKVVE